ncbi:MAG: tol-pal system-associated acyl-CoA thioesterase [Oceanicaulis sp.]|nr:tol-pal system-associated acyl-CoA thioesterase [Oceanicaulis sp.]
MTPEAGQWRDGAHRLPVRVYYEDTDFTGVVYYANYLKFLERGRTDALRTAGVSHSELLSLDPPLGFAVRRISVDYIIPARIDDVLVVETRFEAARGARLTIAQRILRADAVLLTARVDAACIDLEGRPRRLPASTVAALERMTAQGG